MTPLESAKYKISRLNLAEPYVWKLRITRQEFEALGHYLYSKLKVNREATICNQSLLVIAYIAEWYKRCYTGDNSKNALPLDSAEFAALWQFSGIDIPTFVAVQADGTHRWLYSIYVLGGLALQFELKRGDGCSFMRKLCRLYHGVDTELNVSDQNALSFRQSIERRQSLFEFIRSIVNGDFPFPEEDMSSDPLFKDFITSLVEANIKALAKVDKFELKRGIWYVPGSNVTRRFLSLHMRPEETGKGCHGYLRYDRLRAWGADNPDKIAILALSLRFYHKGKIVKEADFSNPVKEWEHTGWREAGMLCCGSLDIICRDLPCVEFDAVEAVMMASTGEEFSVGSWEYPDFCQMWLTEDNRMIWTDRKINGADSLLVFSERWKPFPYEKSTVLRVLDEKDEPSDSHVKTLMLQSEILLTDENQSVGPFYASQGDLKLEIKQYTNVIDYNKEGCVSVSKNGEYKSLPPLFYLADIYIVSVNDAGEKEALSPDKVEYLSAGRYHEWNELAPEYGPLQLRITKASRVWKTEVVYLPSLDQSNPVIRDCVKHSLIYISNDKIQELTDNPSVDTEALRLSQVIDCRIKCGDCQVALPIFRPYFFRRWVMDDKFAGYINTETFHISWILRDRIRIEELSDKGFHIFNCSRLNKKIDLPGSLIENWKVGKSVDASSIDEEAFPWLKVWFGTPPPAAKGEYISWNLNPDSKPVKSFISTPDEVSGIAFKDARNCTSPDYGYPMFENKDDSDFWGDDDWGDEEDMASQKETCLPEALASFLVGCEYNTYFALFPPFDDARIINDDTLSNRLLEPLKEHDGGRISEKHLSGLKRLADEFGFNIDINALRR